MQQFKYSYVNLCFPVQSEFPHLHLPFAHVREKESCKGIWAQGHINIQNSFFFYNRHMASCHKRLLTEEE